MVHKAIMSARDFKSSFLSCEKDMEAILKKLFVDSRPYTDDLKRLLVINNKDCLVRNNEAYNQLMRETDLPTLMDKGYIRSAPKIEFDEHAEVKSYIIIGFNDFFQNAGNPEFRDAIIDFNIICHTSHWDLGDYRVRPLKIMGYIDGILNNTKLSGIGTLGFAGATQIALDENLSGYLLRYTATHGSDDSIPGPDFES